MQDTVSEKTKIVYKVIAYKYGRLFSAIADDPDWRICYIPDVWIKPVCGKIFCFKTYSSASLWLHVLECNDRTGCEIWTAEALGAKPCSKSILTDYDCQSWFLFWLKLNQKNGLRSIRKIYPTWDVPLGTLFCDEIRMIKKEDPDL